jgi:hypothetical protein
VNYIDKKGATLLTYSICGFILIAIFTGCNSRSINWQHPTKLESLWSIDILDCKRKAENFLAHQLDIENDSNFNERTDLKTQFAAHEARKRHRSYFTNCLSEKGYLQVSFK